MPQHPNPLANRRQQIETHDEICQTGLFFVPLRNYGVQVERTETQLQGNPNRSVFFGSRVPVTIFRGYSLEVHQEVR